MQIEETINVNEMMIVHDNYKKYEHVQSNLIVGSNERKNYFFSIVIPTYKRIETLKDTVQSCLCQNCDMDYNIIVVDNNEKRGDSTETYITKLKNPKIKYYKNSENIGMIGNWNRCIELCEGEFAILLHDDDMLSPNYLSDISKIIINHPETDILYVGLKRWNQNCHEKIPQIELYKGKYPLYEASIINCLFTNNHTPTGVVMKKDRNLLIGGFDERCYPSADYYYFTYATMNGLNVYNYAKPLVIYRILINESLNEGTKLKFIVNTIDLHKFLLNKLEVPSFIKDWLLSLKINSSLITCNPETVRLATSYKISYSRILLLKNKKIRHFMSLFYYMQIKALKMCIYRKKEGIDFL